MNKNEILEKAKKDNQKNDEREKHLKLKAGDIGCLVAVSLAIAINIFAYILTTFYSIKLPLVGASTGLIIFSVGFAVCVTLFRSAKKAFWIVCSVIMGFGIAGSLGYFSGTVQALLELALK